MKICFKCRKQPNIKIDNLYNISMYTDKFIWIIGRYEFTSICSNDGMLTIQFCDCESNVKIEPLDFDLAKEVVITPYDDNIYEYS